MHVSDYENIEKSIDENYRNFEHLLAQAESHLSRHQYEAAAGYAQIAADYAWHNHTGLFASHRLENILRQIGKQHSSRVNGHIGRKAQGQLPRHVLHVLTQVDVIGGHTRLVLRWIEQDNERTHSVVFTRQGYVSIPQTLKDAVHGTGGKVFQLDEKSGGLLSRANTLRRLAQAVDQVVLHIHPYDVVPLIAFAKRENPLIFMNHADHIFWIGTSTGDLFAHIRKGSLPVSQERRGIEPERCFVLPLPLTPQTGTLSRSQAKAELGLNPAQVVLLSVASPYKFRVSDGPSFIDTLRPVLEQHLNAVLLVVGPQQTGEWASAGERTQGRIKALGMVEDPSIYYQAADIYLDSFPIGSLTSMLEAGCYGVPSVRYHGYSEEASLFHSDDLALKETMMTEKELGLYQQRLAQLIENQEERIGLGERTKESILRIHLGAGWKQYLEDLYARASNLSTLSEANAREDQRRVNGLDVALFWQNETTGFSAPVEASIRGHLRLLPLAHRLKLWKKVAASSRSISLGMFVPETIGTRMEGRLLRYRRYLGRN